MHAWFRLGVALCACGTVCVAQEDELLRKEFEASSEQHMRDELGVNEITTPAVSMVLRDLGLFQPVSMELINRNDRNAVFANRMQTALHFGSLVADGFAMTIAERAQDVQDIGKALIRQSRALGVGERLARRSKSLFELSDSGNWAGMREELARTQEDVEQSMLDLKDEEMAHMVSLGGWLRGFQLAAATTANHYTVERARILGQADIMDYYLDRLDTLHPRLKETEFARTLTACVAELREIASATNGQPDAAQVKRMSELADAAVGIALGPVDAEGRLLKPSGNP